MSRYDKACFCRSPKCLTCSRARPSDRRRMQDDARIRDSQPVLPIAPPCCREPATHVGRECMRALAESFVRQCIDSTHASSACVHDS